MDKDDLIILVIGLLLLAGMVITVIFGGEKSLHGVGSSDGGNRKNLYRISTNPEQVAQFEHMHINTPVV